MNTLGSSAPPADAGTTTGSAPLPGRNAIDDEVDTTTGSMDDTKSQIDRHRSQQ